MNPTAEQGRSERDTATGRLLHAYRQDGDIRARDRLVQLYLPLVETFAHRYARPGAEYDDLAQAGSIGLLNAIERFDARRGDEFAAFAVPTVVGEIKRHIRDRASAIKLPRRLQDASAQLPRAQETLTARLDREPSERELASELGLAPEELANLRELLRAPAPGAGDLAENGDDDLDASDERVMLAGAFHVLDETERSIVYLRYVRDLGAADVASKLDITESQLARRTQAALAKLRGEIERGGSAAPEPGSRRDAQLPRQSPVAQRPAPAAGKSLGLHRQDGAAASRDEPGAAEPQPENGKKKGAHSGRLLLRMPQSLHAELAEAAEREDVSLNQFITNSLAAALAWRRPADAASAAPTGLAAPTDESTAGASNERRAADSPPAAGQTSPPRWLRLALVTNIVVVAVAAIVAVILLLVAWQQGW